MMKNKFPAKLLFTSLFLIVTILGLLLFSSYINSLSKDQMDKWLTSLHQTTILATTRIPESFTELYFEDHTKLPKITSKKTEDNEGKFEFTIRNLENTDMQYHYSVYKLTDNIENIVQSDLVFLRNGESKTIETKTGILEFARTKVIVELTDTRQSISFWADPNRNK